MSSEEQRAHHAAVSALFLEARSLDPEQWAAFLERETQGDTALKEEVSRLLKRQSASPDFLSTPALGDGFRVPPPEDVPEAPLPPRLAGYQILNRIGAGGMGVVYRARGGTPEREVALKLLRPGMADSESIARFKREAQLLAKLDHPGIAKIHDAGSTDEGGGSQPWIAMEFVCGVDLLTYVRQNGLDHSACLTLMANVCDAIEHAHQRGVVHRDLKPGNIVVDDEGQPHVLDFGVASSLDGDLDRTTLLTKPGEILGTLPYMSPEQARSDSTAVGIQSDTYALGAMLYELLSERRPHDLTGLSLPEAVRVVAETEPSSLAAINPELRGDLNLIVHTAMQHEPRRRYDSAADLAADIRRYLSGEAITASPPSASEQLARMLRRHRAFVTSFAVATAVLLSLVAGLSWGWFHALEAKAEAEMEARRAQRVTDYLFEMMNKADPTVTLREVLEGSVDHAAEWFEDDQLILGRLHHELGKTFHMLGDYDLAEGQVRRAYAVKSDYFGPEDPRTLEADNDVGVLLSRLGRLEEAVQHLERSWQDHVRLLGDGDPLTMRCRGDLVLAYTKAGLHEKAVGHARANHAMRSEVLGEDDPETVISLVQLANAVWKGGQDDAAEALLEDAWGRTKLVLGLDSQVTLDAGNTLALQLLRTNPERGAELMKEILDLRRAALGFDHPDTLQSVNNVACTHMNNGEYAIAEELLRENLELQEQEPGLLHPDTINTISNLGLSLQKLGQYEEAESCFRETLDLATEVFPENHYYLGIHHRSLGRLLGESGRHSEGEPEMLTAERIISNAFPEGDKRVRANRRSLHEFYVSWGRPEEAARWATIE